MEPLANYCSLPMLLPVLPFCIRAQGIAILNSLFLHHPPLLPVSSQYELGVTGGLSLSSGGSSMGMAALGHIPGRARVQLFLPRSQPGKPMALPQLQGILVQNPLGRCIPGSSFQQAGLSLPLLFPGWAACRELPEGKGRALPIQAARQEREEARKRQGEVRSPCTVPGVMDSC